MSTLEVQITEGIPTGDVMDQVVQLNQTIFQFGETAALLTAALQGRLKVMTCLAIVDGQPVGFKLGFEERPYYFESWRGGVHPDHRGQGIAQALMEAQHAWCKASGFRIVTTITDNQNTPMLIVNLRGGFEIVGTFLDRRKIVKVMLQKWLVPPPT